MNKHASVSLLGGILLGSIVAGAISYPTDPEPTAAPAPPSSTVPVQRSASVVINGDLLWHENVFNSGLMPDGTWDFTDTFAPMAGIIAEADLAICHQEVPLAPEEGPFRGYPDFAAPPQTVEGVAQAGFDLCTTASNHSVDAGLEGIERTTGALDAADIQHVGMARTPEEAEAPVIYETDQGVRIGVITGTYGTNGIPVPEPWMVPDLNPETFLHRAAVTRAAGADIVLAAVHAGDEGATQPNTQQLELANILTASPDIDLVYMHHAHAVQPIAQVNDKWVIYGLGNFVANQQANNTLAYDGLTVRLQFTETNSGFTVEELRYIPTLITPFDHMPVSVHPISALEQSGPRVAESLERTRGTVHSMGAPGLVEG